MAKISIIIPTYNHCSDFLKPCLESILQYTDPSIEVIVVANGCTDETRSYVEGLGSPFKLLWCDEKLGYTKATNLGIRAASGDFIVLLNNDVILLGQARNTWIDILLEPFSDKTVGLTGVHQKYSEETLSNFFCFYCVMIKREVIDRLGLLDEIFAPGFGEDIDYCKKMELAGYRLVDCEHNKSYSGKLLVGDFPIYHPGSGTFHDQEHGSKYEKIVQRNQLLLRNRYLGEKLKLNMGAGDFPIDGYLGVDLYDNRSDLQFDMKKLPFGDESVEEIVSYHSLEHINPYEFNEVLTEWYRLLVPGGKLVIEMPDILEVFKDFASADKTQRYHLLNTTYGYGEHRGQHHYWGWYDEILVDHLISHGFDNCTRTEPQTHSTPGVKHYAMRIESNKPNKHIKYSIIIPTYNHLDYCLKPCIESIKKHTDLSNVEVLVVANGCVDGTKDYVLSLGAPFKLLWIDEAVGFIKATNRGILESNGDYIILLNNDTELLGDDWIDLLEQPFNTDVSMGITGPLQIDCSFTKIQYVMFFCAMISRRVINTIGLLDEDYGLGLMDDQDYCLRALKAGFKIMQVPSPYGDLQMQVPSPHGVLQKQEDIDVGKFPIYHKGNTTFQKMQVDQCLKNNMHLLLDKHYPNDVVNIIVPTYKRYNMLRDALTSILQQTYKKIRVFVVSDGPDDKVLGIVDEFNKFKSDKKFNYILFKYLHLEEHEGALGGRVRMLGIDSLPDSGYVCFLDDDNLLYPTYVEKLLSAIGQDAQISYCQINHSHIDHPIPAGGEIRLGEVDSLNYLVSNIIAKRHKEKWIHDPSNPLITHDFDFINACLQDTRANFVSEILAEHRRTETGYIEDDTKVYDCFILFNELDLLELRLNELDDVVDYFVIVEATKTHSGKDKPLYFAENKERFSKFLPKIKHIVVEFPEVLPDCLANRHGLEVAREKFQRDQIFTALSECRDNDIIILSDVDEIINANIVRNYKPEMGICALKMRLFYYFLNNEIQAPWLKPRIFPFKAIVNGGLDAFRSERDNEFNVIIDNAGWHFSFLGSVEEISSKIDAYSHHEEYAIYNSAENIQEAINQGRDIFNRSINFNIVNIDTSYPRYILENLGAFRERGLISDKALFQHMLQEDELTYLSIFEWNGYGVHPEEIKDKIIIDIGGNKGYFSVFGAIKGADRCYCFEPNNNSYRLLLENVKTFPNIIPINLAMSKPGLKQAYMSREGWECQVQETGEGELVNCVSLDDFVQALNSSEDLVMKIDCEGSEYDIIFNCSLGTLRKFKYIYSEIHNGLHANSSYNIDMFEKFMNDNGFESEEVFLSTNVTMGVWYYDENHNPINFVPSVPCEKPNNKMLKFTRKDNFEKPKVYDCFTFFNEFDLLKLRLEELNDVVDYFVLVEGTKTFSGDSKPLYFDTNKTQFAKFLPKIKHIVVDDFPETNDPWVREAFQRDQILKALGSCKENDIIILSDVDEIINADIIRSYKPEMGICALKMRLFYYFVNCEMQGDWTLPKIMPFGAIKSKDIHSMRYVNSNVINNAGWHFSFLGNAQEISNKIKSFSHQEFNNDVYNTPEKLQMAISQGQDIFHREGISFKFIEIDNLYPKYLLNNLETYRARGFVYELKKDFLEALEQQNIGLFGEIFRLNCYNVNSEEIRDKTVIDIGCNSGFFSIFSIVNGAKKCYSFEPCKKIYLNLLENIKYFPNIMPFNLAVSRPGLSQANITPDADWAACQVHENGEGELVDCISLDEVLKIVTPQDDLVMKLDVEGSEYDIILNCSKESLRKFKYIYSEIHDNMHFNKSYNCDMFERFMIEVGFKSEVIKLPVTYGMWYYDQNGNATIFKPFDEQPQNKIIKFTRIDEENRGKVYDCFPFFNELDLLELRLNELDDVVDCFVIAEATKTHSGKDKPLYFAENKERFAKFLHKIKHIIVDDFPETDDPWVRERHQRESLTRGLTECNWNDIIISGDADEIPRKEKVLEYRIEQQLVGFELDYSFYYLNCVRQEKGTTHFRIMPYCLVQDMARGGQPLCQARYTDCPLVKNAGWHFSFMGGTEGIVTKFQSYAHQEYNNTNYTDPARIEHFLENGGDILDKNMNFQFVAIDSSFPSYVLQNVDWFVENGYIKPSAKEINLLPN